MVSSNAAKPRSRPSGSGAVNVNRSSADASTPCSLAALSACAPTHREVTRVDPKAAVDLDYRFNDTDARQVWQGMTNDALFRGWLDRVLANGVAWTLRPGATRITPLLRDLRRIVVVTTHGSSKRVNMIQGEGGKRAIRRSLRSRCHRLCRSTWIALYGIDRASAAQRAAHVARAESHLRRL